MADIIVTDLLDATISSLLLCNDDLNEDVTFKRI